MFDFTENIFGVIIVLLFCSKFTIRAENMQLLMNGKILRGSYFPNSYFLVLPQIGDFH